MAIKVYAQAGAHILSASYGQLQKERPPECGDIDTTQAHQEAVTEVN